MRSYFIARRLFARTAHGGAPSKWSLWSLAENRKAEAHALLTANGNIYIAF